MIVVTEKTVGIQKKNKSYTFFHWNDHNRSASKYKWFGYSLPLKKEFNPVGPTMLVEWGDDEINIR